MSPSTRPQSPTQPTIKHGFPPAHVASTIQQDDLKNRHLMLLCAVLARVDNQALGAKEMELVCKHLAFDSPSGAEAAFQLAIRTHLQRINTSPDADDKALLTCFTFTGDQSDLRLKPAIGYNPISKLSKEKKGKISNEYEGHNYYCKKNGLARKGTRCYFLSAWLGFPNPFERAGFGNVEVEMARGGVHPSDEDEEEEDEKDGGSVFVDDTDSELSEFQDEIPLPPPPKSASASTKPPSKSSTGLKIYLPALVSVAAASHSQPPSFLFTTLPTSISAFSPSLANHSTPSLFAPAPPPLPTPTPLSISTNAYLSPTTPTPSTFLSPLTPTPITNALRPNRSDSLISLSTSASSSPSPPLSPASPLELDLQDNDSPFAFRSPSPSLPSSSAFPFDLDKSLMFDSDTRMLEGLFGDMMDYDYTSPVTHTEEAFDFNFNFMKMMPDMHEEYSFRDITESTTKAEDVVVGSGSGSSHPVAVSTSSQPTTTAQPTEMPIPTDDDLESCRWFNWDPFLFEDSSSLTSSTVVKEEDSISAPTTSASSPSSSTTDVEDTPIGGCIKRKRSGSCSALEEEGACRKKERADGGGVTPRIGTIKVTNPAIYATLIDDTPVFTITHPKTSKTILRLIQTSFINLSSLFSPSPLPSSLLYSPGRVIVQSPVEEIAGVWVPVNDARAVCAGNGNGMDMFLSERLEECFDKAMLEGLVEGRGVRMFGSAVTETSYSRVQVPAVSTSTAPPQAKFPSQPAPLPRMTSYQPTPTPTHSLITTYPPPTKVKSHPQPPQLARPVTVPTHPSKSIARPPLPTTTPIKVPRTQPNKKSTRTNPTTTTHTPANTNTINANARQTRSGRLLRSS